MPWECHMLQVVPVAHKIKRSAKLWLNLGKIGEQLGRSLIINTPVNISMSESDTWWLRAQPSSWAKSGSLYPGELVVTVDSSYNFATGHPMSFSFGVFS